MRAKFGVLEQTNDLCLHAKFCLDRFILTPSGGEKLQILPFYWLWHFVVSPISGVLRKLNTGAQLQTFPYPMVSKSFLYSNAFMVKSCAQTLMFKSVTDKATDRQKTLHFCRPSDGWNLSPTKLGLVIEHLEHILDTSKTFGVWCVVLPLGGAENLWETCPPQLKPP